MFHRIGFFHLKLFVVGFYGTSIIQNKRFYCTLYQLLLKSNSGFLAGHKFDYGHLSEIERFLERFFSWKLRV